MCIQNRELIQMFNAPIHVKPEGGKLNLYIKNNNNGLLTDLLGGSSLLKKLQLQSNLN